MLVLETKVCVCLAGGVSQGQGETVGWQPMGVGGLGWERVFLAVHLILQGLEAGQSQTSTHHNHRSVGNKHLLSAYYVPGHVLGTGTQWGLRLGLPSWSRHESK